MHIEKSLKVFFCLCLMTIVNIFINTFTLNLKLFYFYTVKQFCNISYHKIEV